MQSAADTVVPLRRPEDSDLSAVKTLRKALTILSAFAGAERPLTVAEVAIITGITRPTVHRLVQTLVAEGFLSQNPDDSRLSPGFSVLQLAGRLLDTNQLRLESLPHLEELARTSGERSNLGILHRGEVLFLAGVEKPSLPTIYSRFGKTAPAYCVSLGKAILAQLPRADLDIYRGPATPPPHPEYHHARGRPSSRTGKHQAAGLRGRPRRVHDRDILRGRADTDRRRRRRRDRIDRTLAGRADGTSQQGSSHRRGDFARAEPRRVALAGLTARTSLLEAS